MPIRDCKRSAQNLSDFNSVAQKGETEIPQWPPFYIRDIFEVLEKRKGGLRYDVKHPHPCLD